MPTDSHRCGGVSSASGLGRSSPQRSSLSSRPGCRSLLLTAPRRRCGSRCPRCSSCSSRAGVLAARPAPPSRADSASGRSHLPVFSDPRSGAAPRLHRRCHRHVAGHEPERVRHRGRLAVRGGRIHQLLPHPAVIPVADVDFADRPMVDTEAGPGSAAGCLSLRPAGPVRMAAPRWPRHCAAAWRRSSSSTGRRPRHRRAAPTSQPPLPRPRVGRRRPQTGL